MNLEINKATAEDIEVISQLFEATWESKVTVNKNFFSSDRNILLIAFLDNEPSGFLFAYTLEALNKTGPMMFLYSIDVIPKFQNKGVATRLIERLKEISIEMNCSEMFVLTNDTNEIAKKTYERTGGKRENLDDVMYVYEF